MRHVADADHVFPDLKAVRAASFTQAPFQRLGGADEPLFGVDFDMPGAGPKNESRIADAPELIAPTQVMLDAVEVMTHPIWPPASPASRTVTLAGEEPVLANVRDCSTLLGTGISPRPKNSTVNRLVSSRGDIRDPQKFPNFTPILKPYVLGGA